VGDICHSEEHRHTMSILQTLIETVQPKRPLERKARSITLSQGASDFIKYGYTNAYSATAAMGLYDQSSFVSIPVNKVSKPFSCLQPVLFNIKENQIVRDHAILDLMRNPAPGWSQELFLRVMANHFLVAGDASIVAVGNPSRPPLELNPINPSDISPAEGDNGLPESYQVSGNFFNDNYVGSVVERQLRFFDDADVREFKMIRDYATERGSRIRGQSVLKSASRDVRQAILGTEHNVSILENGGRLSLIFAFEDDMDDEDYEETKRRVESQFGGSTNAGRIGITAGSKLKIQQSGATNQEMDFAQLHEMIKQTLSLIYDVPLPLVSLAASTMNNYTSAILALYDDAVLPLSRVLFGGLSELLLPRYGMDIGEWRIVADKEQVTTLMGRTLEEIKLRKEINIESRNELRSILGRDESVGGDTLYVQSTMIPDGNDVAIEDDEEMFDTDLPAIDAEDAMGVAGSGEPAEKMSLSGSQVTTLIGLVTSVGKGEIERDSAAKIMMLAFNVDMATALSIIGDPEIDEDEDEDEEPIEEPEE
jgi:phage portal protein BeeE